MHNTVNWSKTLFITHVALQQVHLPDHDLRPPAEPCSYQPSAASMAEVAQWTMPRCVFSLTPSGKFSSCAHLASKGFRPLSLSILANLCEWKMQFWLHSSLRSSASSDPDRSVLPGGPGGVGPRRSCFPSVREQLAAVVTHVSLQLPAACHCDSPVLTGVWSKWSIHMVLTGVENDAAILKNHLAISFFFFFSIRQFL